MLGFPFGVVLAMAFAFNDRQALLTADVIGNTANISEVGFEVTAVHSAVHERYGVKNNVAVDVLMVHMGGNHHLKAVTQKPLGKLNS